MDVQVYESRRDYQAARIKYFDAGSRQGLADSLDHAALNQHIRAFVDFLRGVDDSPALDQQLHSTSRSLLLTGLPPQCPQAEIVSPFAPPHRWSLGRVSATARHRLHPS